MITIILIIGGFLILCLLIHSWSKMPIENDTLADDDLNSRNKIHNGEW